VPTARARRTIAASPDELWELISDPYHLPRWWPRVERVENVAVGGFTQVMRSSRGRTVRADFDVIAVDPAAHTLSWAQRVENTPFGRVLSSSETHFSLAPSDTAGRTEVVVEISQTLSSSTGLGHYVGLKRFRPGLGGFLVRRAAAATLGEALDGLERIYG
jgi:uncharacterized protein YndB with AHSA1/START domain